MSAAEVHPEAISGAVEGRSPRQIFWARFGADGAGRDLFVRVLYGAPTSLE